MKTALWLLTAGTLLSGICAVSALGQAASAPAEVAIVRLHCGETKGPRDIAAFSDTRAWDGVKKALASSCYLIRHGDEYLLWDTGYPIAMRDNPQAPIAIPKSIVEQLRELDVDPAKVGRVGISHYHSDHTGQAADFPNATLLMGQGDLDALKAGAPGTDARPLAHWIGGPGKSEGVRADKDVFGDGSVVMLGLPGHTPGHTGLMVRLKDRVVMLTGDLSHFNENWETNGVPSFNTNRADSLASLDRFKTMAKNLKATVIIQHEPTDIAKLPAYPAWAK